MFRDLLSNRLFIGALAFFVLMIVGGTLYLHHNERQDQIELKRTQERIQQWQARQKQTEKVPEGDTSQGGHFHADDIGHVGEEMTQPDDKKLTHTEIMKLPLKQQQQIFNSFYTQHGLKPPPHGYGYLWKEPGIPLLDDNGDPILHKRGEPIVEIAMRKAFTPTQEEYERLKTLDIEAGWQEHQGNTAKAEELKAKYNQLYEKVQRVRPVAGSTLWVAPKSEKESDPNKARRMMKEKLRAALIEQGYSYLIPILKERGEL